MICLLLYNFWLTLCYMSYVIICLPTEHPGVRKNSFRNARAFQEQIGIWKMLVFEEREKPSTRKNLSEQSREPTTNSTHI